MCDQKSVNPKYSRWQKFKWWVRRKYNHFTFPLRDFSTERVYGKCNCGAWTSILHISNKNKECPVCGEQIKHWYQIVYIRGFIFKKKKIIYNGLMPTGGWCSQSLPKELLGLK